MNRYRVFCHIWSPKDGHQDKRYVVESPDFSSAADKVITTLEEQNPKMIVNVKAVQRVEN